MKNIITCFLILMTFSLFSQRNEKISEKIEAKKIAYITQKLDLSPTDAQQFWPLYNEYMDKMKAFKHSPMPDKKPEEMTDKEAMTIINEGLEIEQNELNLKKEYVNKFTKVLSPSKVATLFHLEEEFKQRMIRSLRERMGGERRKNRSDREE